MFPVWMIASNDASLPTVLDAVKRVREGGGSILASGPAAGAIEGPLAVLPVPPAPLPLRVPMTHLIPGSAEPAGNRKPPPRPADGATRSPEAVGGRLASFYQGVRQGRDMGAETRSARRDGQEER